MAATDHGAISLANDFALRGTPWPVRPVANTDAVERDASEILQ
ncbi:UNVERIFIED_ORG: hypothetical protein J2Y81_008156 [Paraburkholderia sediminicola]|nr:hypothetical protein [Paraburkholderia sediminicola]